MASSSVSHLSLISSYLLFFFFIFSSFAEAQTSFRPKAVLLPVTKDASTRQYVTTLRQRTPLVPLTLTVDLGGKLTWVDCESGFVSSSYRPSRCKSAQCNLAKSTSCSGTNVCGLFPQNTITGVGTYGDLGEDVISLPSTNGSTPGRLATVPSLLFTCGATFLLDGLASGVRGIAGLGRSGIGLPLQLASALSFSRKFAICLSTSKGVIFFGDGPYVMRPNIDISQSLTYTPLIKNPFSTGGVSAAGEASSDYFIGVKSIKINDKRVAINSSLLSIDSQGVGGTKFSTVQPYTTLETSIYKAVSDAFVQAAQAMNISRVASVAPFGACFSFKGVASTRGGPGVPTINLVLQNESVIWRMFGTNSMVFVSNDVMCLGFVDGGLSPRTSVVIGGHQLEDILLQLDLAASRVGFTSSLFFRQTTCANFNF